MYVYVYAIGLLISWVLVFGFSFIISNIEVQPKQTCVTTHNIEPTPKPNPIPKPDAHVEKPVLLKDGEVSNTKIHINGQEPEFPDIPEDDLEKKIRQFIEQRLVNILIRVNVASCEGCTQEDKRIIFQFKLMRALYDDDERLIKLYTEQLQPYLKKGVISGK